MAARLTYSIEDDRYYLTLLEEEHEELLLETVSHREALVGYSLAIKYIKRGLSFQGIKNGFN